MIDMRSVAKKLDMPFFTPNPDPITQSYLTGKIHANQRYIYDLCHLGQQGHNEGVGIELAYELSSMIFGGTKNWNEEENMSKACSKVGLDYSSLKSKIKENEPQLIKQIEQNQNDQKLAGHHGVPLLVYGNQVFFGQDRFDDFKKVLVKNGLLAG